MSEDKDFVAISVYQQNRIIELNNNLERANFMYHTMGKPAITDEEYDVLYTSLVRLEEENILSTK